MLCLAKSLGRKRHKEMITKQQIKIIHTLKSALKLSDEVYRARVMGHGSGFDGSSLDLTYAQARELINEMRTEAIMQGVWVQTDSGQAGMTEKRKYDSLGKRAGMATPAQLRMIEAMWKTVSFTHDPEKRESAMRKFIFRITQKSAPEFLVSRDVSKLVNAMRSMRKNMPQTHTD